MKKILILICFLLVCCFLTTFSYSQETDVNTEKIFTSNQEIKDMRLIENKQLTKTIIPEEKNNQESSKITGLVSYASFSMIFIALVFVVVFLVNIHFNFKKK
jgi:hypothetical protein